MRSLPAAIRRARLFLAMLTILAAPGSLLAQAPAREDVAFFETRVRPVLAERCFSCHGDKKQESGLRLDSRAAVLKGSDAGPVAAPGDASETALFRAVSYTGDVQMPPDGKLEEEHLAAIKEWIERGLPWPEGGAPAPAAIDSQSHWAFQKIVRPSPPSAPDDAWSKTPIDRFILASLGQAGLRPSSEASAETLLRRLSFDLTGLPPTQEMIDALLNDRSPDAYEKLVDRLLASPHYGQRWGRHWLDVARYADNKGYVFFEESKFPWAWAYRDYVVSAWNADLPYDRFVTEQLAADQLAGLTAASASVPSADPAQQASLAAMGFLTVGGRFMNNLHDVIDDRIDVVGRGLLGLSLGCARCHDHKFDPVTQADYYSLYGVFRSSAEPIVPPPLPDPAPVAERASFDAEMAVRLKKLEEFVSAKHAELVHSARARAAEYLLAAHAQRGQPATDDFMLIADPGDLNPTMILRWRVLLEKTRRDPHPVWAPWHALAELPPDDFSTQSGKVLSDLAAFSAPPVNRLLLGALLEKPLHSLQEVAQTYGSVLHSVDEQWKQASTATAEGGAAARFDDEREQLRQVFYGPQAPPDAPLAMGWGFLALLPDRAAQDEYKKLLKEVETWLATGPGAPRRAMVLVDDPAPYVPRVFLRGNPNRLGEEVPRRFLSRFDGEQKPFSQGSGRLELARAIVSEENPLTARVVVNRLWMHHFGVGLAPTASDLGLRGDPPSHPQLLDWLAAELISSGWSLKHLQRLIVTSSVYRQRSDTETPPACPDVENRLLWRMNRQRLSFEAIRDALLAVTGDLDERIGGPPLDLFGGAFVARRTIYGSIDRLDTPGLLTTFDFPSPLASNPRRDATTVPPQALYLMNNDFIAEAARRLAKRTETSGAVEARIAALYLVALGRHPSEAELAAAKDFLGASPAAENWAQYAHALLMTNEFVFVD